MKPEQFRVDNAPALIREQALEKLRAAIVTGYYKPGDRLIERELCEMIGVSRTSIREVLRQLEAERLIKVEPRKGPVVTSISPHDAREIYEVRRLLEGAVAEDFVKNASDRLVGQLTRAARDFEKAANQNNLTKMVAVMSRFYDVLLEGAGNSVIMDMLTSLHARISFLRGTSMSQPGRVSCSVKEINTIAKACAQRDAAAAHKAATEHVEKAAEIAISGIVSKGFVRPTIEKNG